MDAVRSIFDVPTVLVFFAVLLAVWLYRSTRIPGTFPPGPRPLPILGNLLGLGKDPAEVYKVMTSLKDKYGPIIGLRLGSLPTVLLSSSETVKEALVEKAEDFSDRPHAMYAITQLFLGMSGQVEGIGWSNGGLWRHSRRFGLSFMRDFGVGKRSVEERIYDEAKAVCDVIASTGGSHYDALRLMQQATSNIICSVCFGTRFEYTDPDFIKMMTNINILATSPLFNSIYNFIPSLRFLPFKGILDDIRLVTVDISAFIDKQIDQHRLNFDPKNPRDFLDVYLLKEHDNKASDEGVTKENVSCIIRDLFLAGTETSSTSLRWLLLLMIRFPEIQRRCQEELDRVVGSGRHPMLTDRPHLPYIEAVIQEMLRHSSFVPISFPHVAARDTTLSGYRIPKDTAVLINLYAVNNDPVYWQDPRSFNPDRWLGSDGKLRKRESFMPFSAGPRLCLGESLARAEIFVFYTFLLQRFTFSCVEPENPPTLEGVCGVTLAPVKYEVIANPR